MEKVLISACLLGCACRYDGECREYDMGDIKDRYELIPFCPEIFGGLPTPRIPSEIRGDKVINSMGEDVTDKFLKGANEALRLCRMLGIKKAVLKSNSPSCGKGYVYDGTFSGRLTEGDGITARLLSANGIDIKNENDNCYHNL